MAPLLRHSVGTPLTAGASSSSRPGAFSRPAACTLFSHEGPGGDRSFLVIRERPGPSASGERLVLRGDFGASARGRLAGLLSALPATDRPLQIDLRRVVTLDEGCLSLLLNVRRGLAAHRPVLFLVAEAGPVRRMVCRRDPETLPTLLETRPQAAPVNGVNLPV